MCLLVNQPRTTSFDDEFLTGVYTRNQDGLGVMYAEDDKIHVFKCLPANAAEFIDFYRKHAEGKDCVWHARMQTHGDIDFENCHPYKVTDDIWMAHNGVLSTGNAQDQARSDTWHFIKNVLRPMLKADPDLLLDADWIAFMGSMIGSSNKFGFVRSDGVVCVVNQKSGVTHEGAWLSNTYAWGSTKLGGYTNMYTGYGRGTWPSNWHGSWNDADDEEYSLVTTSSPAQQVYKTTSTLTSNQVAPMVRAAYNQWMRRGVAGIEQWVFDAPHKASALLSYWYEDVDGVEELVESDPISAAEWIEDLFTSDSIQPSMLN